MPDNKKFFIIGLGRIGQTYVRKLIGLGLDPGRFVCYDVNADRYEDGVVQEFGLTTVSSLDEGLDHDIHAAFVLVNTFSHEGVLLKLLDAGVKHIFVETPLAMPDLEHAELAAAFAASDGAVVHVGYLINFSAAVGAFVDWFQSYNATAEVELMIGEARGRWQKSRVGDARASAGDLEDNMPHMLALSFMLAGLNGSDLEVDFWSADMAYTQYVEEGSQLAAAHAAEGEVMVPNPNSTTAMCLQVGDVNVFLTSSFVAFDQERVLELTLHPAGGGLPTHAVRLMFDHPPAGGVGKWVDSVEVRELSSKDGRPAFTTLFREELRADKLDAQIGAFLQEASGGERDPRVTTFDAGLHLVHVTAEAAEMC